MNIGLVFGIIFAIIVMGFVVVFAAPQIMNMFAAQEDLKLSSTLNSLENHINDVYFLSEHSMVEFILDIPQSILFCFVDYSDPGSQTSTWQRPDITIQSMINNQMYNVWYFKSNSQSGRSIEHLFVDSSFCVRAGTKLYLENKGTHVDVSVSIT